MREDPFRNRIRKGESPLEKPSTPCCGEQPPTWPKLPNEPRKEIKADIMCARSMNNLHHTQARTKPVGPQTLQSGILSVAGPIKTTKFTIWSSKILPAAGPVKDYTLFTKFNRLSILVANSHNLILFRICSIFQPMEQALPSPSDGWHACSRRCQLALDLTAREQASPTPLCTLRETAT